MDKLLYILNFLLFTIGFNSYSMLSKGKNCALINISTFKNVSCNIPKFIISKNQRRYVNDIKTQSNVFSKNLSTRVTFSLINSLKDYRIDDEKKDTRVSANKQICYLGDCYKAYNINNFLHLRKYSTDYISPEQISRNDRDLIVLKDKLCSNLEKITFILKESEESARNRNQCKKFLIKNVIICSTIIGISGESFLSFFVGFGGFVLGFFGLVDYGASGVDIDKNNLAIEKLIMDMNHLVVRNKHLFFDPKEKIKFKNEVIDLLELYRLDEELGYVIYFFRKAKK